jgi:uncharacterized protein DUF4157
MRTVEHKKSSSRAGTPARPVRAQPASLQTAGVVLRRAPTCACGGSCPRCTSSSSIRIGPHDDDFEREADAVADRVMRMPSGEASLRAAAPALQRKCAACEEEDDEQVLQTKRASAGSESPGAVAAPVATTHVRAALDTPGHPLTPDTRAFFEPRFGADFSDVRLHSDAQAHQSAREVNARAFTVGRDIVFGRGEFSPDTSDGRRLIAHELAHVVQQSGPASSSRLQRQGAPTPPCPQSVSLSSGQRPVHVPSCGTRPVTAAQQPSNAPVTWSLAAGATTTGFPGSPTAVDPATSIDAAGAITVSPTQTPGFVVVTATGSAGCTASVPLNFASTPTGVGQTAVIGPLSTSATNYGAQFENTLNAASGNSADLFQVKVNERFSGLATPNASTHLVPTPFGNFTLNTNPWTPNSDAPGWAVTASGVQGPDNIGTARTFIDVGRFVSSASNRTPTTTLSAATPVGFSVQQDLHWFCAQAAVGSQWVTPPFATLTHTRHLMLVSGDLTFVTGIPAPSLAAQSDPYTGQPAFMNAAATPNPVTVSATVPPGSPRGTVPPPRNTTTVTADTLPSTLSGLTGTHDRRFSIRGNARGCTIDATTGVVTVGTTPGTITVRVGDVDRTNRNFDETTVTIAAASSPSAPAPVPPAQTPGGPQAPHPGLHIEPSTDEILMPPPAPDAL